MAFALTINVGSIPSARNPYPAELSSLDNRIFATAYGFVPEGGSDTPVYLTWDAAGNVTVIPAPLPAGPDLKAWGDQNSNTIEVEDPDQQLQVGMRAFGGFLTADGKHGNAMPDFAIVLAADPPQAGGTRRKVTLNGKTLVAVNDNVQFSRTVPDQEITGPSLTLQQPTDRTLKSVRIIFTIGGHAWLDTAADGSPKAPTVHDDPYHRALTWDFAEFTMDVVNGSASKFTLNQSMIDQFGFPIQIAVAPAIAGQPNAAGVLISLEDAIAAFRQFIAAATDSAQKVFGDLAAKSGPVQPATDDPTPARRIVSPADRVRLPNVPPQLNTYFDEQIVGFFNKYDPVINPGATLTMFNVGGGDKTGKSSSKPESQTNLHDLQGSVIRLIDGQRVLRLTDVTSGPNVVGEGKAYDIYEPFWHTNGYSSTHLPAGHPLSDVPAEPPAWITSAQQGTESPGIMVFGGDGVFADNNNRPDHTDSDEKKLLGAIENMIVTAINRGIALNPYQDWLYSSKFLQVPVSSGITVDAAASTLTLAKGLFDPQIVPGMVVTGTGIAAGAVVQAVDRVQPDGPTTITLTTPNTSAVAPSDVVFSWVGLPSPFFHAGTNPNKVWNYYSQFFHQESVVRDGLAYAYAYDDQVSFSSTLAAGIPRDANPVLPQSATITLGLTASANVHAHFELANASAKAADA